jgi:hypothetical protein
MKDTLSLAMNSLVPQVSSSCVSRKVRVEGRCFEVRRERGNEGKREGRVGGKIWKEREGNRRGTRKTRVCLSPTRETENLS